MVVLKIESINVRKQLYRAVLTLASKPKQLHTSVILSATPEKAMSRFMDQCSIRLSEDTVSPKVVTAVAHDIVKKSRKLGYGHCQQLSNLKTLFLDIVPKAVSEHCADFSASQTYQLLWTMAKMAVQWPELPASQKRELTGLLQTHAAEMNAKQLTIALWSLAKTGCNWRDLPLRLRINLESRLSAQLSDYSARDTANTLWALAMMDMHVVKANRRLLHRLFEHAIGLEGLNPLDMTSLCFAYFQFCAKLDLADIDIYAWVRVSASRDNAKPSHIQVKIYAQLERLMLVKGLLQQEVFLYDAPVDILCEKYGWIIEVDGPHHHAFQQQLSDRAHNTIRSQGGYVTVRIDVCAFEALGDDDKTALLKAVVDAMHKQCPADLDGSVALTVVLPAKRDRGLAAGLFDAVAATGECKDGDVALLESIIPAVKA